MSDIEPSAALLDEVAREAARPASPLLGVLVEALQDRFGDALVAVLLYGSCLHDDDVTEGLVDLYAIVDDYAHAYPQRRLRWLNHWIPPNVFYVERSTDTATLRSKYAVLSLEQLRAGCTEWFHSYLWARFAQPVRLVYARDETARDAVHGALAGAVRRFLGEGAAAADPIEMDAGSLWASSLRRSYAAELRAETGERAVYLVDRNREAYGRLTAAIAPELADVLEVTPEGSYVPIATAKVRLRARRRWSVRRWQGRALSLLRLSKALFTFENGLDYLAWKVERHTGERVEVSPRVRKYPLIFGWGELWRLLRSGVLR